MSIDPRLMERRKTVAEDKAKKNVTRLLKFLVVVLAAGAAVWLVFSPWLSISLVETEGIESSSANSILVDAGVVAGTPMIAFNPDAVERALLGDPWVAQAMVRRDWPNGVVVEVVERVPAAWVQTEGGWARRALDGVALPSPAEPDPSMGWVELPTVGEDAATESAELLGGIEFVASLPESLQEGAVVTLVEDELWAVVSGYQVRLGLPVEMGDKALSLVALLGENPPEGSTLNLIAPTNPAVMTPQAAGDDAAEGESDDS
jgi:POTRA domain, FtsQ-type